VKYINSIGLIGLNYEQITREFGRKEERGKRKEEGGKRKEEGGRLVLLILGIG
jgi:hypothetical protein